MLGALRKLAVGCLVVASALSGVANGKPLAERAAAGDRLVFCHFMVCDRSLHSVPYGAICAFYTDKS